MIETEAACFPLCFCAAPVRARTVMKLKVKKWVAVGVWKWNVENVDTCCICQQSFEACCPDCKFPGDDCPPGASNESRSTVLVDM